MQEHVLQVLGQELLDARERQRLIVEIECQEWGTARVQPWNIMQRKINSELIKGLPGSHEQQDIRMHHYLASRQDARSPRPST